LEFFRDDAAGQRDDVPAFFRSLRSVRAIERKQARAFADVVRQFAVGLESYVELPPLDVPRIPVTSQDVERVEDIASRVRQEWGLNSDQPLSDLVVELERHGIIVTRATFDTEKMDAFSVAFEDHPVVVLCSDKGLRDRSRFDAAHELGHLVMHDPEVCGMRWAESQANRFAAAFLMPSEGIAAELPATPEWPRLVSLKRKWGVSIAALLVRARTLGIMAPEVQIQAFKTLSARGWRTSEPEPLGPPETPKLLRNAIRMLDNSAIPGEQLVELTAIPMDQIARIYAANAPPRPKVEL
jgi:Zn-dependent peptidase ImmA (M78 family)